MRCVSCLLKERGKKEKKWKSARFKIKIFSHFHRAMHGRGQEISISKIETIFTYWVSCGKEREWTFSNEGEW
jgi:hypothetical protein